VKNEDTHPIGAILKAMWPLPPPRAKLDFTINERISGFFTARKKVDGV
jgi:hypothetical protein